MTRKIALDIINNPQSFIDEIVRNHGTDSIQYVFAMNIVREINNQQNKEEVNA